MSLWTHVVALSTQVFLPHESDALYNLNGEMVTKPMFMPMSLAASVFSKNGFYRCSMSRGRAG